MTRSPLPDDLFLSMTNITLLIFSIKRTKKLMLAFSEIILFIAYYAKDFNYLIIQ